MGIWTEVFKAPFIRGSPSLNRVSFVQSSVFCAMLFFNHRLSFRMFLWAIVSSVRILITHLVSSNFSYNRYYRTFYFIIPSRTVLNELSMLNHLSHGFLFLEVVQHYTNTDAFVSLMKQHLITVACSVMLIHSTINLKLDLFT